MRPGVKKFEKHCSIEYSIFSIQPPKTEVVADFVRKSIIDSSNQNISPLHNQNDINRMFYSQVYDDIGDYALDTVPVTKNTLTPNEQFTSQSTPSIWLAYGDGNVVGKHIDPQSMVMMFFFTSSDTHFDAGLEISHNAFSEFYSSFISSCMVANAEISALFPELDVNCVTGTCDFS